MKLYKPVEKVKRVCQTCKETFLGVSTRVFCCYDCRYEWQKRVYKKNYIPRKTFIPKILNCKNCNNQFTQNTTNQIYCSSKCCSESHRKKYELISLGKENPNPKNTSLTFLKLRFEIFKRDGFRCKYCGRNPREDKCKLVIEHIIPRVLGGTNNPNNLVCACQECNLGKADILLENRKFGGSHV